MTIAQVEGKLLDVNLKIADSEARLKLFKLLKSKGMCTRDIFQAAKQQLRSKRVTKHLNKKAISRDMISKIEDASKHLSVEIRKFHLVSTKNTSLVITFVS